MYVDEYSIFPNLGRGDMEEVLLECVTKIFIGPMTEGSKKHVGSVGRHDQGRESPTKWEWPVVHDGSEGLFEVMGYEWPYSFGTGTEYTLKTQVGFPTVKGPRLPVVRMFFHSHKRCYGEVSTNGPKDFNGTPVRIF